MRVRSSRPGLRPLKASALIALVGLLLLPSWRGTPAGGYPGSGPAPGWAAVPTPATANDYYPTYDSTGLTVQLDMTPFPGQPYNPNYEQLYQSPGGYSSGDPIDYSVYGPGVGGQGLQHEVMQIYGSSTYKWQWTAPGGDLTDFPVPPLYVLGRVDAGIQTYNANGTNGLSGTAMLADGWGWSQTTSLPGDLPTDPSLVPRRHVVATSADGSLANTMNASLSPSLLYDISGAQGQATGWGVVSLLDSAFPIVLSSPNPLTDPMLGDGSNQYVYSADTPDGYLYVPGAINVVGGGHDDAMWLLNNGLMYDSSDLVDLKIDNNAIPNAFSHDWSVSNGTIYVNTPNNNYPSYQFNSWVFKGLPDSFSKATDGNHEVNLYVQGNKSQTAHIQTFYNSTASNYPGADIENDNNGFYTPNWYHYFSQAFPQDGSQSPYFLRCQFEPILTDFSGNTYPNYVGLAQSDGYYDQNGNRVVEATLCEMGPNVLPDASIRRVPVFGIGSNGYLDIAGALYLKGIYRFLYTAGHETEHVRLWLSNEAFPPDLNGNKPSNIVDTDGDNIPDSVEGKYHLDPGDPDTTGYYSDPNKFPDSGYTTNGDEEAIANIGGIEAVVNNPGAWQNDWSNAGVQYGSQGLYFPWEYVPKNGDSPTIELPSYPEAVTSLP